VAPAKGRIPRLPSLLDRKIYKTGQTRGADDDSIRQNRVGRNSTVLIPYQVWEPNFKPPEGEEGFQYGYIVLIPPATYFALADPEHALAEKGLVLGTNALVFYETREQWLAHNPDDLGWAPATSRLAPLGGTYVARVPATTAADEGERISRGFNTTANKGAGISVYEYAGANTIRLCRTQLEGIFWLCRDAEEVLAKNGMAAGDIASRRAANLKACEELGLLDQERLRECRAVNKEGRAVCPLCLEELSAGGFFKRLSQAEGRETPDLTVTELNLFHIDELRYGAYEHRPYNLTWGHHHCNVVVRDAGIRQTLDWMAGVLRRNAEQLAP
jgi:hypothetical protein